MITGIIIGVVVSLTVLAAVATAVFVLAVTVAGDKMNPRVAVTLYYLGRGWFEARHWVATWLRWIAHLIDGRNTTLGQCCCSAIQRPWPMPKARHRGYCKRA